MNSFGLTVDLYIFVTMKALYSFFITLAAAACFVSCLEKPLKPEIPESMAKLPSGLMMALNDVEDHDIYALISEAKINGYVDFLGNQSLLPGDYLEKLSVKIIYGTETQQLTLNVPCTLKDPVTAEWKTTVPFTADLSGLADGTVFYFSAKAIYGNDATAVNPESSFFTFPKGPVNLDLKSGNQWASVNLGAESIVDSGNYYAWGETAPKQEGKTYDWVSYKWIRWITGSEFGITKYCLVTDWGYKGFKDDIEVLEGEDDAATQALGAGWRTPSTDDWTELLEQCEWKPAFVSGTNGWLVRSKANPSDNKKVIFLPCCGYRNGTDSIQEELNGFYWSSTLNPTICFNAYSFQFNNSEKRDLSSNFIRANGLTVRPVKGK